MPETNTCCFIGHGECFDVSKEDIKNAIEDLINLGVTDFLSGGQGGFDRMCAGCVNELKNKYPNIQNILVIPYLNFNVFNKDIFDAVIYPENFENYHFKAAIPARNKYIVASSKYAVCYITHSWGGAAKTFEIAKNTGLHIINLVK